MYTHIYCLSSVQMYCERMLHTVFVAGSTSRRRRQSDGGRNTKLRCTRNTTLKDTRNRAANKQIACLNQHLTVYILRQFPGLTHFVNIGTISSKLVHMEKFCCIYDFSTFFIYIGVAFHVTVW